MNSPRQRRVSLWLKLRYSARGGRGAALPRNLNCKVRQAIFDLGLTSKIVLFLLLRSCCRNFPNE